MRSLIAETLRVIFLLPAAKALVANNTLLALTLPCCVVTNTPGLRWVEVTNGEFSYSRTPSFIAAFFKPQASLAGCTVPLRFLDHKPP